MVPTVADAKGRMENWLVGAVPSLSCRSPAAGASFDSCVLLDDSTASPYAVLPRTRRVLANLTEPPIKYSTRHMLSSGRRIYGSTVRHDARHQAAQRWGSRRSGGRGGCCSFCSQKRQSWKQDHQFFIRAVTGDLKTKPEPTTQINTEDNGGSLMAPQPCWAGMEIFLKSTGS